MDTFFNSTIKFEDYFLGIRLWFKKFQNRKNDLIKQIMIVQSDLKLICINQTDVHIFTDINIQKFDCLPYHVENVLVLR